MEWDVFVWLQSDCDVVVVWLQHMWVRRRCVMGGRGTDLACHRVAVGAQAGRRGEPWITGWSQSDFRAFAAANGWVVQRDVTIGELCDEYFTPANRELPENQRIPLERYACLVKQT